MSESSDAAANWSPSEGVDQHPEEASARSTEASWETWLRSLPMSRALSFSLALYVVLLGFFGSAWLPVRGIVRLSRRLEKDETHEVCSLIAPLLRTALRILNTHTNLGVGSHCTQLDQFFGSSTSYWSGSTGHVGSIRYHFPKTTLDYIYVYKGGNEFIRCQVANAMSRYFKPATRSDHLAVRPADKAFTFIREPASHFISGYSEVEFRLASKTNQHLFKENPALKFGRAPINSPARARMFIRDALQLHFPPRHSMFHHIDPMVSVLRAFITTNKRSIDFVGRLESFENGWEQVKQIAGVAGTDILDFHPSCGKGHAGSNANSGMCDGWLREKRQGMGRHLETYQGIILQRRHVEEIGRAHV